MRILHFYTKDNDNICQYVNMLKSNTGLEAETHVVTELKEARALMHGGDYDVLHVHGCWRNAMRTVVNMALEQGTRLVVTPHGELEPWVQEENYLKEKLPKKVFYQRSVIRKAYAVIIQGKMEQECLQALGWNKRCVIIRNALFTNSITPKEMARQTFAVYRKVMDSNTLELMDDDIRDVLKAIVMAGITGDKRWLPETTLPTVSYDDWRRLLCYAHQEGLTDVMKRGVRALGLQAPDIEAGKIDFFLPDNYQPPQTLQSIIGNQFPSENERLLATFKTIKKLVANGTFCMMHLVELDRELRNHGCKEDELNDMLQEKELWKLARRTMQLMADLTGLTEGFMPVEPLDDRTTRRMRQQIEDHLKI
jgi:hypothetical protein